MWWHSLVTLFPSLTTALETDWSGDRRWLGGVWGCSIFFLLAILDYYFLINAKETSVTSETDPQLTLLNNQEMLFK